MTAAPQKIFPIRREYNSWVADETLEDYALRYTPRSARRWSEWQVANTAFGGVSFLALEAIGATIALSHGFSTAAWAILIMGVIIFLTALPIAICAARLGLDMDLLTRGAGFGYLGSTITSLIYATFTFIFFALEAAIMALAMQLALGWPLAVCYIVSSLVIIPMVLYGITFISRLQAWTQPVWAALLLTPYLWLAIEQPHLADGLMGLSGLTSGSSDFDLLSFGAAATVIFALVVQVGEQVDYLRFMPERTRTNRWRWWSCVLIGGPGWIIMGMLRMLGGAFLAYVALQYGHTVAEAVNPTRMYLNAFWQITQDYGLALWITLAFVVIAQIKINVTNAYAGSLAWSNVFSRLTRSHPGRVVWLVFNVMIATLIMTLGVFAALEKVLGIYSNVAVAWVGTLVADLVINKPLGLSPKGIEFRRAYLHDLNPVGLGAMGIAAVVSSIAFTGIFGPWPAAFAPFIALALALLLTPLLAWLTRGKWYLARPDDEIAGTFLTCIVCENTFERPDMARCPAYGGVICSLCCSLDSRCQDRCKPPDARASVQLRQLALSLLPAGLVRGFNVRLAAYAGTLVMLAGPMALTFWIVYAQHSLTGNGQTLKWAFLQTFSLLALLCAVYAWVDDQPIHRQMPGDDGFTLCRHMGIAGHQHGIAFIKAHSGWAHVPVIFMTGLSETEQIVQGFEAGGVDYVVKPIRIPEVLARLARHMHNATVGRLARAAIDIAGMGMVLLDRQSRFAWRSPQATHWLEQAFESDVASSTWLRDAIAQGRVNAPLLNGQLQAQYLGQVGVGEAMLVLAVTAENATTQRLREAALTPRETEVLGWLAKGKTNRDIAEILALSPRTVNKHLEHVFEKLGVETRAAAAAIATAIGDA